MENRQKIISGLAPVDKQMEDDERDFNSSDLGTKAFWDRAYDEEITNFKEIGDIGEIWFGTGSQKRVINWLKSESVTKDDKVLDLGCGNGVMLIELRKCGYKSLTGVDYSEGAITLANEIAGSEGITDIIFRTCDILSENDGTGFSLPTEEYQLCLDKGTYDAISLMPENSEEARKKYRQVVAKILTESGRLVITSCNWTKEQLVSQFQKEFSLESEIPTPTFQFGGSSGRTVTSLVFKKKDSL